MRWQVAISNFSGDRRLLSDVLAGLSAGLVDEDGQLFLTSTEFDALDKSGDVHTHALRIESIINEASYGELADRLAIAVGNQVVEKNKDGRRLKHTVIAVGTAKMKVTAQAVAVSAGANANLPEQERKRIEAELKEREYQRSLRIALSRVGSAYRNEQARKIQGLLREMQDTNILWHIYEIIENDLGGAITNLAPANQLTRFTHSVNHPKVYGDSARHAVSNAQPPRNPMRLDEARQFIQDVAERWMEHKAGLNDGD
jgi:hypothetical protein